MKNIEDCNLFMMCEVLNKDALSDIPKGYSIRNCGRDELDIWCEFPFDNECEKIKNKSYMEQYFENVYRSNEDAFWKSCLFICDKNNIPVGTCFAWKAYGNITTIHWFKVRKEYEGRGIGRALISNIMNALPPGDFPVFLHTQPGSYRAIKLYSDLGFSFLTDHEIGYRKNELDVTLPFLKEKMPLRDYNNLKFANAPKEFLLAAKTSETAQF